MPFRVQKTGFKFPFKVEDHVAVTWKNTTIVWGGYDENTSTSLSVVHCHQSGEWTKRETGGDIPCEAYEATAEVIHDAMFVLGAFPGPVHSLDLNSWTWTRISPGGDPPEGYTWNMTSWVYRDKIFCFGGEHSYRDEQTNQLICYNTNSNTWEWPDQGGDIPSPRVGHAATISGDTAFVFGGVGEDVQKYNDLHILDMLTMRWKKVHGNLPGLEISMGVYTLTRVSESAAVLYGHSYFMYGQSPIFLVLDLHKAKHLSDPSSIWTRIPNPHPRFRHASVIEPVSQRLWIIGGNDGQHITSDILEIPIRISISLRDLAIGCAVQSIPSDDSRLEPGRYPKRLRDEIEEYRSRWGGPASKKLKSASAQAGL